MLGARVRENPCHQVALAWVSLLCSRTPYSTMRGHLMLDSHDRAEWKTPDPFHGMSKYIIKEISYDETESEFIEIIEKDSVAVTIHRHEDEFAIRLWDTRDDGGVLEHLPIDESAHSSLESARETGENELKEQIHMVKLLRGHGVEGTQTQHHENKGLERIESASAGITQGLIVVIGIGVTLLLIVAAAQCMSSSLS